MGQRSETVELPLVTRVASIVPNSVDVGNRTVDVVWTTGARVMRGYYDRYWEELSLDPKSVRLGRLNNGAPLLNAHDDGDANGVIGVVVPGSAAVDGKRGTARVRFARAEDDPIADQIFRKVADGIVQNLSVGYATYRLEKVEDGKDKIPVYRATDWEPMELSPVPIGADDGAGFRSESTKRFKCTFIRQETKMADEDETPTPTPSGESAALTATRAAARARVENAAALAAAAEEASQAAITAERTRAGAIRTLARKHGMGDTWAMRLIDAGSTVNEAREAILADLAERDSDGPTGIGGVNISAGDDERDKWLRGASAAMIDRLGFTDLVEAGAAKLPKHKAFVGMSSDPGEFRGMSPLELARDSLERQRISSRGLAPMEIVARAFTAVRSALQTRQPSSFQTTSDFAVLLESVLNKILLGSYATQQNTWTSFSKQTDVKDFRPSNQYRTGSLPSLQTIREHGEYQTGVIPDGAKYAISTSRLGIKFSLSRETIVNDDMGALAQVAEGFGQASARTLEENVYALLALNSGAGPTQADTNPFFHTSRGNVSTTAALAVAALDADRVQLRTQKDPSNRDFLDLVPSVLLVPDSLYGQANVINTARYDVDKVANGRVEEPNRVLGLFKNVVSSPRLTGTRRYIFAQTMDAIVVAFLQGYGRTPIIETLNGWNIDGVEWKITLYANAQMGDPKSALTNAG